MDQQENKAPAMTRICNTILDLQVSLRESVILLICLKLGTDPWLRSYDFGFIIGSTIISSKIEAEHVNINIDINIYIFLEIYIILPLVLCC